MACCPSIIGGPVNVTIAGLAIPGRRIKLTTEGSLTVKAKNFTISDRDTGLGHSKTRNNSVISGTFILTRGILSTDQLFPSDASFADASPIFNDDVTGIQWIKSACGLTVTLESECGDAWIMNNAAETSEGEQDIYEGTADFRFSSAYPVREINLRGNFGAAFRNTTTQAVNNII